MAIIYDNSGYIYDSPIIYDTLLYEISFRARIKGLKQIEIKGRINPTLSIRACIWPRKTISIKGRIIPTLSIKSRIIKIIKHNIPGQARISRRQGWPVAELDDPGYLLWQDTRLYIRTNIYSYLAFPTQTIKLKSSITYNKTYTISSRAKIVTGQQLQIKANILPRFFTANLPVYFSARQTVVKNARVQFVVSGDYRVSTLSTQTRIIKTSKTRITGHFIVPLRPVVTENVLVIPDPIILARVHQTLSIRAKVT